MVANATLPNFICRSEMSEDPIEFNEKKRKLIGEKIHNSFLHPKPMKTGELFIKPEQSSFKKDNEETKKQKVTEETRADSNLIKIKKHKFSLI